MSNWVETGARVRELRDANGVTQEALGRDLGLGKDQVSKSEKGVRRFTIAELLTVADLFGTTVQRLMGQERSGVLALAARVTGDADPGDVEAVRMRARQLLEVDALLAQLGSRRDASVSAGGQQALDLGRGFGAVRGLREANRQGAELAKVTRDLVGLGTAPIGRVDDLAERHFGVDVDCGPYGPGVSGACVHDDDVALIMANTSLTAGHLRFTLAHELGHHVLGDPSPMLFEESVAGDGPDERRVNSFAANLLMPPSEVEKVVAGRRMSDEVLAELMQYFQVSLGSLVIQLADCKLIPFDDQRRWSDRPARQLVSKYGDPSKENPTREGLESRAPVRLLASARDAQREGLLGATVANGLLRQDSADLAALAVSPEEENMGTDELLEVFAGL